MSSSFEIGLLPTSLLTLDYLGLPNPHPVSFKPYAKVYVDGQGQPRGDGYASATWHFDALTHTQLQTFMGIIGDNAGHSICITTRTDIGTDYADSFRTFSGMVRRPMFGDQYDIEMARSLYTDITFEFIMLVEEEEE